MNMERPIAGAEHGPLPIVAMPKSGLSGIAIGGLSLAAAALLFLVLNNQRLARDEPVGRPGPATMISAPPPLRLAPVAPMPGVSSALVVAPQQTVPVPLKAPVEARPFTPRAPRTVVIEQWPPSAPMEPAQGESRPSWAEPPPLPARTLNGPAIVQDSGEGRQWSGADAARAAPAASGAAAATGQGAKGPSKVSPQSIGELSQVIAVGTMIEAVLETPIDTSRPGMTRAVVSKPVRSFDGSRVLIPRGARLVGEMGGQAQGGNRLLVQWSQLILPNGVALDINSPGADANGRAGLDARSHGDFGRFIGGVLQTAVTVGAAAFGARGAPVYYGMPLANGAAQVAPVRGGKRLTVAAGAQITVVVARTLDFEMAEARS